MSIFNKEKNFKQLCPILFNKKNMSKNKNNIKETNQDIKKFYYGVS